MSARAYGHHMAVLQEIQDEITEHDKHIDEEKKLVDEHMENIRTHQKAIKNLREEQKEKKDFITQHS